MAPGFSSLSWRRIGSRRELVKGHRKTGLKCFDAKKKKNLENSAVHTVHFAGILKPSYPRGSTQLSGIGRETLPQPHLGVNVVSLAGSRKPVNIL